MTKILKVFKCLSQYEVIPPTTNITSPPPQKEPEKEDMDEASVENDNSSEYSATDNSSEKESLDQESQITIIPTKFIPCFSQTLPPNIKKAEIVDVDDDGLNELLVTLTDRVVRTYQWRSFEEFSEEKQEIENSLELRGELEASKKWEFGAQVGGASVGWRPNKKPIVYVTQPEGTYHKVNIFVYESLDVRT